MKKFLSLLLIAASLVAEVPFASAAAEQSSQKGQNYFTYSEQLDNAAWIKGGTTVSANTTVAPDGTFTADTVTDVNAVSTPYVRQVVTLVTGRKYTMSATAKAGTIHWLQLGPNNGSNGVYCDVTNGALGTIAVAGDTAAIRSLGNGYYQCSLTFTATSAVSQYVFLATGNNGSGYTGTGTSTLILTEMQINEGTRPAAYNRTVASALNTSYTPAGAAQSSQKGQNLLTYSEQFDNGAWVKSGGGDTNPTISPNTAGTTAPDGSSNADKFIDGAQVAPAVSVMLHTHGETGNGTTLTYSVFAKAGTLGFLLLAPDDATKLASFNLTTGASQIDAGATAVGTVNMGNGWWRCWVTYTRNTANVARVRIYLENTMGNSTYQGTGTGSVYLWGAQLAMGSKPAAYNRTVASAINASYVPAGVKQSSQKGQNFVKYSEQFDNAAWGATRLTVAANAVSAYNGSRTAETLTDTVAVGTTFYVLQASAVALSSTLPVTRSVYAKAGTKTWIRVADSGNASGAWFNLGAGVVGNVDSGVTAKMVSVGNGWYRCSVTFTGSTTGLRVFLSNANNEVYTGDGTGTVFLWGGQLEQFSYARGYNPTVASAINP